MTSFLFRRLIHATVLLGALVACKNDRPPVRVSGADGSDEVFAVARFDGIGPVRAGMRLAVAAKALDDIVPVIPQKKEACNYVTFAKLPKVAIMVIGDTIMRFDVDTLVKTEAGVVAGDSEQSVIERYGGRARISPHKYTGPEGHYVTVDSPTDTLHRIVFESDGTKITTYRFGRKEQVDWVEGCS